MNDLLRCANARRTFFSGAEWPAVAELVATLREHPAADRVYASAVSERTIAAWAERNGVKPTTGHACFARLVGARCDMRLPRNRRHTAPCQPPAWDHGALWVRGGRPVVLTSQPYGLTSTALHDLVELCDRWGVGLSIDAGSWHYPGATLLIEMWAPGVDPRNPFKAP